MTTNYGRLLTFEGCYDRWHYREQDPEFYLRSNSLAPSPGRAIVGILAKATVRVPIPGEI